MSKLEEEEDAIEIDAAWAGAIVAHHAKQLRARIRIVLFIC
jgi:hypothetical protein